MDLDYVLNVGIVHAALNTFSYEFQTPAQTFVWDWICSGHPDYTNLGRACVPCPSRTASFESVPARMSGLASLWLLWSAQRM